jgi:putative ABC transport system substrate-binding protein
MRRLAAVAIPLLIVGLLVTLATAASKPPRIGVVFPGDEWVSSLDGLRDGMTALGYVEGRDVVYVVVNTTHDKARLAETTRQFVRDGVDVIFTITTTALKVVIEASRPTRIPIVFGSASGPVETGLVPAYGSADSHVTGVTSASIELVGKRLEILKELLPHVRRVAVIGDRGSDSSGAAFAAARAVALRFGLSLIEIAVGHEEEAMRAVRRLTLREADALVLLPSLHPSVRLTALAAAARDNRLPFAVYQVEHVRRSGALVSYGSSFYLQGRQSAKIVDKILRGQPVAQIPIERPKVHELVLNVDTARAIGLRLPAELLNRADRLIDSEAKR